MELRLLTVRCHIGRGCVRGSYIRHIQLDILHLHPGISGSKKSYGHVVLVQVGHNIGSHVFICKGVGLLCAVFPDIGLRVSLICPLQDQLHLGIIIVLIRMRHSRRSFTAIRLCHIFREYGAGGRRVQIACRAVNPVSCHGFDIQSRVY